MKLLDGEILFLYDAKMTNPNGDPDEENKPRMDYATSRALVSDVRLKRYLRDYWLSQGRDVWVRTLNERTVSADQRLRDLQETHQREAKDREFVPWLLDRLIDVRLFGATMPIKARENESRGSGLTFTGPVQFTWGYSLHPVEIMDSSTISSTFAGRENEHGTFGKDWRIYYGLIAFMGRVSTRRGQTTHLQETDLDALEEALLKAIPAEAVTRSKFGQTPRLYLHVRYREGAYPFPPVGDLRDQVRFLPSEGLEPRKVRAVGDYRLDLTPLTEALRPHASRIEEVRLWVHPELRVQGLEGLPHLHTL
ncbi:type I-B CRISPR-associated protein Cas7/Csh2 [Marinithermus hydrothermalis]|uniref:CRISPR-associated protein, Csh2 family n=1 Tax=Marinithermus hydrothermalis (strain DSM 14884 / JCM 11576 / T1) TaxID=869210 RepID=F2NN53_MARHT|nr:type I-B CRISPR-associated protein Cas7/Csh2 [Marinithermus hydrothermalis]AEB12792.1 CRISPR-associated protein, Csh2 family [Marinithermus hydrothermalis DSM 14884]